MYEDWEVRASRRHYAGRRRILFVGFVARMEDTMISTPEVRDVRRIGGGCGLRGGAGERVVEVSAGRPQSLRHQRRPVDDCSPVQGGMTQDGGTMGGTFHREIDALQRKSGLNYGMQ